MIQLHGVDVFQGGRRLLAGVTLTAEPGRVTAVLGAEGSGKTALADVACGVLAPDAGRVEIDGIDIAADPVAARRRVGYMPQDAAVYRDMTPRSQLRFVGQVLEMSARALGDRVEKTLRRTGLAEAANTPIRTLPRALLQRVTLAQALMTGAGNIVLDCPTDGLDAKQIFELRAILRAVFSEEGDGGEKPAVLVATDNLTEACQLAARVYVLEEGAIVGRAAPDALAYLEPDDERTVLRALGGADAVRACLEAAGLRAADCAEEDGLVRCAVETGKGFEGRRALFAAFAAQGLPIVDMRPARRSMEEIVARLKSEAFAAPAGEEEEAAKGGERA